MGYLAFYRKYRPTAFSEVIGQKSIIEILKTSIINNKISHAYLFNGPRGTGKTSVAKIFAKTVNCLKNIDGEMCGNCLICKGLLENDIDIIEMDAASNNSVDEIREIRNNVKLAPTIGKYKVYIIDEVHMLSIGAFNALLKTLEEPPEHVIFILATTEIQKIPLTILSRCQRFDFKKISSDEMVNLLEKIIQKEKKKVNKDVLQLISELSEGCVRDATNLLDQILSTGKANITVEDIFNISGDVSQELIKQMFVNISMCNLKKTLDLINDFFKNGKNFLNITNKLILYVRNILINNNVKNYFSTNEYDEFVNISNNEVNIVLQRLFDLSNELKKTVNQKIAFEIKMFDIINCLENEKTDVKTEKNEKTEKFSQKNDKKIEKNEIISREIIFTRINNVFFGAEKEELEWIKKSYTMINDYISNKKYNLITNILLKSEPVVASKEYIMFKCSNIIDLNMFLKKHIDIEKFLKELLKKEYKVIALTNDEWKKEKNNYIKNKKNGVLYKYINEPNTVINSSKINNTLVNVFGEENITLK